MVNSICSAVLRISVFLHNPPAAMTFKNLRQLSQGPRSCCSCVQRETDRSMPILGAALLCKWVQSHLPKAGGMMAVKEGLLQNLPVGLPRIPALPLLLRLVKTQDVLRRLGTEVRSTNVTLNGPGLAFSWGSHFNV